MTSTQDAATRAPAIEVTAAVTTVVTTVLCRPVDQRRLADSLAAHAEEVLASRPGFHSASLHVGVDPTRVLCYEQWLDPASAADSGGFPLRGRALAVDRHSYEVVHTADNSPGGVTRISTGSGLATFVNVMHTTPDLQDRLVQFVVGNDARAFGRDPRYRSANFHRSLDGERVVNYSQWTDEQGLLDVVAAIAGRPLTDMAEANAAASAQADPVGWTDFGFYEVSAVVLPAARGAAAAA